MRLARAPASPLAGLRARPAGGLSAWHQQQQRVLRPAGALAAGTRGFADDGGSLVRTTTVVRKELLTHRVLAALRKKALGPSAKKMQAFAKKLSVHQAQVDWDIEWQAQRRNKTLDPTARASMAAEFAEALDMASPHKGYKETSVHVVESPASYGQPEGGAPKFLDQNR